MRRVMTTAALLAALLPASANAQSAYDGGSRYRDAPTRTYDAGPVTSRSLPHRESNGVPGQAPFNNQLRKFSDPLNANGAK